MSDRISPALRRWSAVAIASGCLAVGVTGVATHRLDAVQTRWEDGLQPGVAASTDPAVVVVGLDRTTLAALGDGWPVGREVHAALIDAIADGGPRAIVYDVLFATEQEGDDVLATALRGRPTVIASALTLRAADGPPRIEDAVRPTGRLAEAASTVAHANVSIAADTGIVRSLPVYAVDERGIPTPSLALAAVALADGTGLTVIERPGGVQIGGRRIPLANGELSINWSSELAVDDVVPAIDVLDGTVDPERFEDAVVIIGATEPTLGDQHLVPVDRTGSTPGVLVIANAVNTMLTDGYLADPATGRQVILVVTVGLVTAAGLTRRRLGTGVIVALATVAAVVGFAAWRFHHAGEHWDVVWPTLTAAFVVIGLSGWRYVAEIRHRRRAWALFATYVPASVVEALADPARLRRAADGERLEVSVLFCDLRGFTPIAARLDPSDVRRLLDRYYEYAVGIVHDHGGTVMQFVGDEVFAVFGAPIASPHASVEAVACAGELQDRVGELDAVLAADSLPTIRFGIGVHRGWVTTAHVGTTDRRQYAAIGDTVNVGSRLCGAAGAGEIVASTAAALEHLPIARLEPAGDIPLKGVARPVEILRRSNPNLTS